jgi:hypothetical protein
MPLDSPSVAVEVPAVQALEATPVPLVEAVIPDVAHHAPLVQTEIEKPPVAPMAPAAAWSAQVAPLPQPVWGAPATPTPSLVEHANPVHVVVPAEAAEQHPNTPPWNKQKATAVTQVRWISQYVTLEPATTRYWRPRTSIRWIRATTWFRPDYDYYYEEAAGALNKAEITTMMASSEAKEIIGNFPINSQPKESKQVKNNIFRDKKWLI